MTVSLFVDFDVLSVALLRRNEDFLFGGMCATGVGGEGGGADTLSSAVKSITVVSLEVAEPEPFCTVIETLLLFISVNLFDPKD